MCVKIQDRIKLNGELIVVKGHAPASFMLCYTKFGETDLRFTFL